MAAQNAVDSNDLSDVLTNLQNASGSDQPRTAADLIRESRERLDKILTDQKAKLEKAHTAEKAETAAKERTKTDAVPLKTVDLTSILKAYSEFDTDHADSKTADATNADAKKAA